MHFAAGIHYDIPTSLLLPTTDSSVPPMSEGMGGSADTLDELRANAGGAKCKTTHAVRKGAATVAGTLCLDGASMQAICMRGDWTLGHVLDR